jgi:hypothetical protein
MRCFISSLLAISLLLFSSATLAAKGMVLMGDDCDYQLLAMSDGAMALIKTVDGARPQKHDLLSGNFPVQSFGTVTNERTHQSFSIWVDQISASASQVLSQYSSYCNAQ